MTWRATFARCSFLDARIWSPSPVTARSPLARPPPPRLPSQRLHALLDVGLQDAEHRFMTLNRQRQGVQEPLRGVVVHDAALRDLDRILRHSDRLRIETEVDDQLFRRAGHAAEV